MVMRRLDGLDAGSELEPKARILRPVSVLASVPMIRHRRMTIMGCLHATNILRTSKLNMQ